MRGKAVKTSYTPGPWCWDSKVWDYDPNEDAPWLVNEATMEKVLRGAIKCNESNARLIAAAPELLEALQKLCPLTHRDTCKGLKWGPMAKEEREQDCDCGAAIARKAIAKALGGTP